MNPVRAASGALNFDCGGYPFQCLPPWSLADWSGALPTAKTVTLHVNHGNMPLKANGLSPREFSPHCIRVYLRDAMSLNAVELSNRGCRFYLEKGAFSTPFPVVISLAVLSDEYAAREAEISEMVETIKPRMSWLHPETEFQLNVRCPNLHPSRLQRREVLDSTGWMLERLATLDRRITLKWSLADDLADIAELDQHPAVSGHAISNGVHWGLLPDLIPWGKLFGSMASPLAVYGGGTLSGAPLLSVLLRRLEQTRDYRIVKPLGAGGGIMSPQDVELVIKLGWPRVRWIELGTIGLLRPWRVQATIRHAHDCFRRQAI